MKRIKVLIISEYFPPKSRGGGEISSYLLAKNLVKQDVDVSVLTSYFDGLKNSEVSDGIKVYRRIITGNDPKKIFDNIKRILLFEKNLKEELIKLDKENNFDVIHCMNITSIAAVEVKSIIKKKFIVHINSPLVFCPQGSLVRNGKECKINPSFIECYKCFFKSENIGKIRNRFYIKYNPLFAYIPYNLYKKRNKLLKDFDYCIGSSSAMKDLLEKEGIKKDKIDVVWNIVDYENFLRIKSKKNTTPNLMYLGAYIECQGVNFMLEALKDLEISYKANFYGSGPLEVRMKDYIKHNKINAVVHAGVPYETIYKIYAKNDIIIFPTLAPEGFGRIPLEAMAASKPVIASKIGGVKDIVDDKITGLMIEPGNKKQLRDAIKLLTEDPELREKLGTEGRKTVISKFNGDIIAEKMIRVYKKVIGSK